MISVMLKGGSRNSTENFSFSGKGAFTFGNASKFMIDVILKGNKPFFDKSWKTLDYNLLQTQKTKVPEIYAGLTMRKKN